jgi:hypothetical protein
MRSVSAYVAAMGLKYYFGPMERNIIAPIGSGMFVARGARRIIAPEEWNSVPLSPQRRGLSFRFSTNISLRWSDEGWSYVCYKDFAPQRDDILFLRLLQTFRSAGAKMFCSFDCYNHFALPERRKLSFVLCRRFTPPNRPSFIAKHIAPWPAGYRPFVHWIYFFESNFLPVLPLVM